METASNWNQKQFPCKASIRFFAKIIARVRDKKDARYHQLSIDDLSRILKEELEKTREWRLVQPSSPHPDPRTNLRLGDVTMQKDGMEFALYLEHDGFIRSGQVRAFHAYVDDLAARIAQRSPITVAKIRARVHFMPTSTHEVPA